MTLNGISGMNQNYSSYRMTNSYSESTEASSSNDQVAKTRPDGPPPGKGPGGPRGGGGPGKGPDLDLDDDDLWSTSEVESYAAYSSETLGIELDADTIMSTYDTDEDGSINATERQSLAQDNAFNLPSPQSHMQHMQGFKPMPNIQAVSANENTTLSSTQTEDESNLALIEKLLEAYNVVGEDATSNMLSTMDFNI